MPVYGRVKPVDRLLVHCYRNALQIADEKGIASIALPAISAGAFGYPLKVAVTVAMDAILDEIPRLKSVQRLAMILFSEHDLREHEYYLNHKLDR